MIPLDLPYGSCKKWSASMTISLTSFGISTNHALDYLIPNKMKGETDGFMDETTEGSAICIFLDVCSFLGDYPAAYHMIDIVTYSAVAAWTPRTFRYHYTHGKLIHSYKSNISAGRSHLQEAWTAQFYSDLMCSALNTHIYWKWKKGILHNPTR